MLPRHPLKTADPLRPHCAFSGGPHLWAVVSSVKGPQGLGDLPCRRFVPTRFSLRVTSSGAAHVCVCSVCVRGERGQPGHNTATPLARQSAQITPSLQKLNTARVSHKSPLLLERAESVRE